MQIWIELDERQPPSGRVRWDGRSDVAFQGWLGLIRVLNDAIAPADQPEP